MEKSMEIFQKIKKKTTIWSSSSIPGRIIWTKQKTIEKI